MLNVVSIFFSEAYTKKGKRGKNRMKNLFSFVDQSDDDDDNE